MITVESFINWYCHPEAVREAKKELEAVWNQNVLSPGPDFEVCEFLEIDLIGLELKRLATEMECELSDDDSRL